VHTFFHNSFIKNDILMSPGLVDEAHLSSSVLFKLPIKSYYIICVNWWKWYMHIEL